MPDSDHSRLTANESSQRISVRVSTKTINELDILIEDGHYHNRSTAVREAIDDLIDSHREGGDLPDTSSE